MFWWRRENTETTGSTKPATTQRRDTDGCRESPGGHTRIVYGRPVVAATMCMWACVQVYTPPHQLRSQSVSQSVRSQSEQPGSRLDDAAGWWAERNRSGGANRPHLDHSTSSSNSLPLHRPAVCRKPDLKGERDWRLGGPEEQWTFESKYKMKISGKEIRKHRGLKHLQSK